MRNALLYVADDGYWITIQPLLRNFGLSFNPLTP